MEIDYDNEQVLKVIDLINGYSQSYRSSEDRYLKRIAPLIRGLKNGGMDTRRLEEMVLRSIDDKLALNGKYTMTPNGGRKLSRRRSLD